MVGTWCVKWYAARWNAWNASIVVHAAVVDARLCTVAARCVQHAGPQSEEEHALYERPDWGAGVAPRGPRRLSSGSA